MSKISMTTVSIAVLALVGSMGCATKGFVRTSVGELDKEVNSLSTSLEQTQDRVQANEARIREVDQETDGALQAANKAAKAADAAADLAKTVEAETEALEEARRKLVYEVVMSEQQGGFAFDSAELTDSAKQQIDELVAKLKQERRNMYITIEGHTDYIGSRTVNEKIGLERARAVEQYLYEQHRIPLHKMEVISYGEANPVAPNTTRGGRAQNRRVEIKVLS
jgi:outer membrane protein OmpA-like peptidoglycan-associated protein